MNFFSSKMIFLAGSLALCGSTSAAEIEASGALVCAMDDVHECVAGDVCESVYPADVGIHERFLTVDFGKKEIRSRDGQRKSAFTSVRHIGNKLQISGAEIGGQLPNGGAGYSLTINKDSGSLVLSATGDEVAFIVFGACTPV